MSEWEEKLNTLLSDPDAMAQVMNIAQNLSQQMGQSGGSAPPPPPAGGGGGALPPDCPICCDRFCAMFITCAMASGSESRVFSFSSHSLIVTPSRGFYFFALSLMRFIMAMPSGLFIRFESIVANSFVLPAAAFCAA